MKTFCFDSCVRMSPESFEYLLNVASLKIAEKDSRLRKAIAPSERLCLTFHFLAYDES